MSPTKFVSGLPVLHYAAVEILTGESWTIYEVKERLDPAPVDV